MSTPKIGLNVALALADTCMYFDNRVGPKLQLAVILILA